MKDEIKEILDKMKNYSGECHSILAYSLCGYKKKIRNDFRMCMNDVDKLLDCITNLQEKVNEKDKEIDRLNNIIDDLEKYILNHYIVGHQIQNASLDDILNKLKELKEGK